MSIKSITINQANDDDNYIELLDNQYSSTNRPADTSNKLYANTSGLYWEDLRIDLGRYLIYDVNGNELTVNSTALSNTTSQYIAIDATSIANNDLIRYSNVTNTLVNFTPNYAISNTYVVANTTAIADTDLLTYDNNISKWINITRLNIDAATLGSSSANNNYVLTANGTGGTSWTSKTSGGGLTEQQAIAYAIALG